MSGIATRLKSRRGITLVLTLFMFMVFMGLAAFVVDFGRMYLFRAQLQAAADGAALAGMFRQSQSHNSDAQDTAIAYGALHRVDTVAVTLVRDSVIPGTWTTATGFVQDPGLSWSASSVDAVKVTALYTGQYTLFGRSLGFSSHRVSALAVAVRGSLGTSRCVRPFAIPYQALLQKLTARDGVTRDPLTYNLTATDVSTLSSMGASDSLYLKVSSIANNQDSTAISPNGNYYAVDLPPIVHNGVVQSGQGNGAPPYENAIEGCSGDPVSVGDWLAPENGSMIGPTNSAITNLCPPSGVCSPAYKVVTAIWDRNGTAVDALGNAVSGCGGKCFHVKYLGEFSILGYSDAVKSIYGYFNTLTTSGGFTVAPGPVQVIALVK